MFGTTQIANIAIELAKREPTATSDQIGTAIEFVSLMIEDLEIEDAEPYLQDFSYAADSVQNALLERMAMDAEYARPASYLDLVAA